MEAKLLLHIKKPLSDYEFTEIKVWKVKKNKNFPEGVKYSMVYIKKVKGKYNRIFGVDNERGKGHHKHINKTESELEFKNWKKLLDSFYKEVEKLRGENNADKRDQGRS